MGVVLPLRRQRAAGFGAVAKVDPLASPIDPVAVAKYVERRRIVDARVTECTAHRQYLAIAGGVGLSLGLTAIFMSKTTALRLVGAALAGGGAVAGAGAYYSHTMVNDLTAERAALDVEIKKTDMAKKGGA